MKFIVKIFFLILFTPFCSLSQNENSVVSKEIIEFPKILLNYYSIDEINDIKVNDSLKFNTLCYYYTSSFEIEKINCDECMSFDSKDFDINIYEHKRLENENVSIENIKYGFRLTLIAEKDLKYKLPIHLITNHQHLKDEE